MLRECCLDKILEIEIKNCYNKKEIINLLNTEKLYNEKYS